MHGEIGFYRVANIVVGNLTLIHSRSPQGNERPLEGSQYTKALDLVYYSTLLDLVASSTLSGDVGGLFVLLLVPWVFSERRAKGLLRVQKNNQQFLAGSRVSKSIKILKFWSSRSNFFKYRRSKVFRLHNQPICDLSLSTLIPSNFFKYKRSKVFRLHNQPICDLSL